MLRFIMKRRYSSLCICILTITLSILILRFVFIKLSSLGIPTISNYIIQLFKLEPETPTNLDDPPYDVPPIPENEVDIEEVLEKGVEIPFVMVYNDPKWKRPAFKEYWHSKYGRWSYVPIRIHYALHRLFVTYETASRYYDFIHDLGIREESFDFKKYESISPLDYMQVVIMNTVVERVITYQNQVVIVGRPQRTGLQAINIPTINIQPIGTSQNILFQLVTPDGYEIDDTTIILDRPK